MDETTNLFLEKAKEYFSYEKLLSTKILEKSQIEGIFDKMEELREELTDMIELSEEE